MTDVEKQETLVASDTGISREATTSPPRTSPPDSSLSPSSTGGGVRNATKRMLGWGSSPGVGLERVNTTIIPPSQSNTVDLQDDDKGTGTDTTVSRKSSSERLYRYSTRAFARVERPVPVADVLQGARFVVLMRITYRFLEFWIQTIITIFGHVLGLSRDSIAGCGLGPRVRCALCRKGAGPDVSRGLVEHLYVASEAMGKQFPQFHAQVPLLTLVLRGGIWLRQVHAQEEAQACDSNLVVGLHVHRHWPRF